MPKKKDDGPKGAPEWVLTYGDLMSLLLCFFILLAAFSELKQEREYLDVLKSIKESFGYQGGVGAHPNEVIQAMNNTIDDQDEMALPGMRRDMVDDSVIRNKVGKHTKVDQINEGLMFTIGGGFTFDAGSAVLKDDAKGELKQIAELLQGKRNKISVRGHATGEDGGRDLGFLRDLSYRRAKAVGAYLRDDCGIDEVVLSIDARGATEPVMTRADTAQEHASNRRVQVIMTEAMVDELVKDITYEGAGRAR